MHTAENRFWDIWNQPRTRPVDLLVNSLRKERNPLAYGDLLDFVYGCSSIAWALTRIEPDFVVFPQRGALPIDWTIRTIQNHNYEDFYDRYITIYPQTGTYFNVDTGKAKGMSYAEKEAAIEVEVAQMQKLWQGQERNPVVVLIDEVSSGSTMVTAVDIMGKKLRQLGIDKIYAIGAQDSRVLGIRAKTELYTYLAVNADQFIETQTVNLPLFFMDVAEFLDYPLEIGRQGERRPPIHHILINEEGRKTFEILALVVQYPEKMVNAANRVHQLGAAATDDDPVVGMFIDYINDLMLPDDINFRIKATNEEIVRFWSRLAATRIKKGKS